MTAARNQEDVPDGLYSQCSCYSVGKNCNCKNRFKWKLTLDCAWLRAVIALFSTSKPQIPIYEYLSPSEPHNAPVYMHIPCPRRRLWAFPRISAGHLQMSARRCHDVLPQLSYHFHFGQIFIAAASHIVCQRWCAGMLECVWLWRGVHVCDKQKLERGKKQIIFWWEGIYFKQDWNLHMVMATKSPVKLL